MVEQAKNLINNLSLFTHVLSVLLILPNIVTSDAFNKIGLNNTSSSAQVKIQHQGIPFFFQMYRG